MTKESLYENGYFVVDNFLDDDVCRFLRESAIECNHVEDYYDGYRALNYSSTLEWRSVTNGLVPDTLCKNVELSEYVVETIPNLLIQKYPFLTDDNHEYQRGWYFIHDNHQLNSVKRHKDTGAYITANIWVTPDEFIEDYSPNYNGFIVHTPKQSVTIPYKYNRMTMFFSQLDHESQLARFKSDLDKRKVNFTFLFGKSVSVLRSETNY